MMKVFKRHVFLITACLLLTFICLAIHARADQGSKPDFSDAAEDKVIYIGVLANRGAELCLVEWGPTADYLSAQLQPYEFRILPLGFDEILSEVSRPDTQISFVSANSSYYTYMEYHGMARRIATLLVPGDPAPQSSFGGTIFTRSDRMDIRNITDLRNMHFAAVDSQSLGGWHAALREIRKAGLEPNKDFQPLTFTGTHDDVVHLVLSGNADAGTVRSSQLERMAAEGLISLSDIRIINDRQHLFPSYPYLLSTQLYPEWPFAAVSGVDPALSRQVALVLLMMDRNHPAAKSIRGAGWTIPEQYVSVHDLLRELLLPPYDDYGITLGAIIKKYWPWLLTMLLLFFASLVFGIIVFFLKMRAQKIAKKLQESEEMFRNLTKNLSVGVAMIGKDMKVLLANPKMQEWFPADNYNTCPTCHEVFNYFPGTDVCPGCPIVKTLTDGNIHKFERELEMPDGKRYFAITATAIKDADENITAAIEMVDDITERKETENRLMEMRKLADEANKAKSEFLANMSHEIRTPLNSVIGFSELLKKSGLSVIQKSYVENVNTSAHALLGIINDILDLSKIEADKLELEVVKTDIIDLVEQALDIVRYTAAQKKLELLSNVDMDLPVFVEADPVRLKQILLNLLSNAIKFTDRGEVELKVAFEAIDEHKGKLRFSVHDTGIGISQENQNKIFSAFMQADTSTTRKYGGSGLGLTISALLAKKMNSLLHIKSQESHGSEFSFTLETTYETGQRFQPKELSHIREALLVVGNAKNRRIIEHTLSYWGIECIMCETGGEALNILQEKQSFDLVLFDFDIPGNNSLDTIRKIRDGFSGKPAKQAIIIMHNFADADELFMQGREPGIHFVMNKPLKLKTMFENLKSLSPDGTASKAKEHTVKPNQVLLPDKNVSPVILLVEDVDMNLLLIKTLLKKALPNAKILEATDGSEAVVTYKANMPDIIFMDVQMPVMDGLEATAAIRNEEQKTGGHVIIIALTARSLKDEVAQFMKAGMDDFISKPIQQEELNRVLIKYVLKKNND